MSWLLSPNIILVAVAVAAGTVVFVLNQQRVAYNHGVTAGKTEIIEASKEEGKKANEEATKAHTAASKPGAADRLRKHSCRDCGP